MKLHKWGAIAATVTGLLAGSSQAMPTLVGMPTVPVTAGNSFTVILQDNNITDGYDAGLDVYLAEFQLNFDSTFLSLTLVTPNPLLPSQWVLDPGANLLPGVSLVVLADQPSPPSGPVDLFELTFQALQTTGITEILVTPPDSGVGSYGANSGSDIFQTAAARVEIQADTTPRDLPEPQSLALMAIAGLGAIAARRRSSTSR